MTPVCCPKCGVPMRAIEVTTDGQWYRCEIDGRCSVVNMYDTEKSSGVEKVFEWSSGNTKVSMSPQEVYIEALQKQDELFGRKGALKK